MSQVYRVLDEEHCITYRWSIMDVKFLLRISVTNYSNIMDCYCRHYMHIDHAQSKTKKNNLCSNIKHRLQCNQNLFLMSCV